MGTSSWMVIRPPRRASACGAGRANLVSTTSARSVALDMRRCHSSGFKTVDDVPHFTAPVSAKILSYGSWPLCRFHDACINSGGGGRSCRLRLTMVRNILFVDSRIILSARSDSSGGSTRRVDTAIEPPGGRMAAPDDVCSRTTVRSAAVAIEERHREVAHRQTTSSAAWITAVVLEMPERSQPASWAPPPRSSKSSTALEMRTASQSA